MRIFKLTVLITFVILGVFLGGTVVADGKNEGPKEVIVVNTDAEPIPVAIQGAIQVDVQSQSSVDINSMPDVTIGNTVGVQGTVNIGNIPTVLNGDHPALSHFVLNDSVGDKASHESAQVIFSSVCGTGEKIIVTHISGTVRGESRGHHDLPPVVYLSNNLGLGWYVTTQQQFPDFFFSDRWIWSETTNHLIFSSGFPLKVTVSPESKFEDGWSTILQVRGYCFSP